LFAVALLFGAGFLRQAARESSKFNILARSAMCVRENQSEHLHHQSAAANSERIIAEGLIETDLAEHAKNHPVKSALALG
jgi:N-acetylmuramoyl-L-alanine amidase CwlA